MEYRKKDKNRQLIEQIIKKTIKIFAINEINR